jgi:hypothetical protein
VWYVLELSGSEAVLVGFFEYTDESLGSIKSSDLLKLKNNQLIEIFPFP